MGKKLLRVIAALVIIAAAIVYYMWNKPHRNVNSEAAAPVTAANLFDEYSNNEPAANSKYLDKLLLVTGEIAEIKKNQEGKTVLVFKTADPVFGVLCTMQESPGAVTAGTTASVKGFCSGYTSDVVLREAVIVNKKE